MILFIFLAAVWSFMVTYIWYSTNWKSSVTENLYLLVFIIVTLSLSIYCGTRWDAWFS